MLAPFDPVDYGSYIDQEFRYRWLRPHVLNDKLLKFREYSCFSFKEIGRSEENRPIHKISFGAGPQKILMWSQMHGNEPTATMAIIDLLNFLSHRDKYDELRQKISEELTLIFIPMLNPDGAERFERRNAFSIDMNRDALKLHTAEMRLFMEQLEAIKPHFAFNLHDQRNLFSVGETGEAATISLLAPTFNKEGEINDTRKKSMQLIVSMTKVMEQHYPFNYSRFSDKYYPRALGEYLQSHGISTILIESGGYFEDPFRDVARKMNFLLITEACLQIISGDYKNNKVTDYHKIPASSEAMMDIIIRDCSIMLARKTIVTDIGLMKEEVISEDGLSLEIQYQLKDIGDLSFNFGYREFKGGFIKGLNRPELESKCNFTYEREEFRLRFEKGRLYEEHQSLQP